MPHDRSELLKWARAEADRLRRTQGVSGRASTFQPLGAAALEFLRRHAAGTKFLTAAEDVFRAEYPEPAHIALTGLSQALEGWAQFVEDGMAETLPFPVTARMEAATDLMEQVQQLLDDQRMHPAAPVMLAGAALEEFLRSMVAATGAAVTGKPSINAYASALRSIDAISAQDMKDITSWAGSRNDAAHGHFDQLSRERAQIMADGINLFIRQHTP